MIRTIYYCDWCQIEIGERCKEMWHQVKYDDNYGQELHYDWHFCSEKCMLLFKTKRVGELK